MGQKVHPTGMRLNITTSHNSKWYADNKDYAQFLITDIRTREEIKRQLSSAGVSRVLIERPAKNNAVVTIEAARPGIIIGKKGEDVEKLRRKVSKLMGVSTHVNIREIRKPELDADLVAQNVAQQIEKRVMFRRAMKRAVTNAMRSGALGIKIKVSGRLGGAEIARSEWYREGRVPLHTFRADIDYGIARSNTTYGIIGVKVWIFKGEIFELSEEEAEVTSNADA